MKKRLIGYSYSGQFRFYRKQQTKRVAQKPQAATISGR